MSTGITTSLAQANQLLSAVAYALGLKLAVQLRRWDDARDQLDLLREAAAAAEHQIAIARAEVTR